MAAQGRQIPVDVRPQLAGYESVEGTSEPGRSFRAAQGRISAIPRRLRVHGQSLFPIEQIAQPVPEPLRSQETGAFAHGCSNTGDWQNWALRVTWWVVEPIQSQHDFLATDTASGT